MNGMKESFFIKDEIVVVVVNATLLLWWFINSSIETNFVLENWGIPSDQNLTRVLDEQIKASSSSQFIVVYPITQTGWPTLFERKESNGEY